MANTKKFIVRDGFIVILALLAANGKEIERRYEGGETVELDEDQYAAHMHKLEFADEKDRKRALAAEEAATMAAAARSNPVDLVNMLTAAIGQAIANAGGMPQTSAQQPQA